MHQLSGITQVNLLRMGELFLFPIMQFESHGFIGKFATPFCKPISHFFVQHHLMHHIILSSPIELWDVSQVTSFWELFRDETRCNPDISAWNVSKGPNFVSVLTYIDITFFIHQSTHGSAHSKLLSH